jgi:hypothetical protein
VAAIGLGGESRGGHIFERGCHQRVPISPLVLADIDVVDFGRRCMQCCCWEGLIGM